MISLARLRDDAGKILDRTSGEMEKAKILVVDDDPLIAMNTADMLADLGHVVIEANSGASALNILKSEDGIHLLITDYSMPKMNGVELATAAQEIRPSLAILIATGYDELPAGSDPGLPRISKPYGQAQLSVAVEKILATRAR
jgi:CheY-like chemotaxis protein